MSDLALTRHQASEIVKCLRDAEYFVETYCWLQQKASAGVAATNSIIPFQMGKEEGEPHFFQRKILRWLSQKENVLTLKSRRVGCSWIAAAYAVWLINFHENVNVLFISRTGKEAKKILDKVKFILMNLALHDNDDIRQATRTNWMKGEIVTANSEQIAIGYRDDEGNITVRSVVESITTTDDAARGDDATFIIFDELAFYEHPEETWSSATKTLALGGHWMAISTPGGIGDVFHRLCARGDLEEIGQLDEPLGYKYIKIHYRDAGITEEQVRRSSIGDDDERKAQEWDLHFISSGSAAFNSTHLAACYKPLEEYPEIAKMIDDYRQLVATSRGEYYFYSGVDTASGKQKIARGQRRSGERDYHSFTALSKDRIQMFAYHSKEPMSQWAGKIVDDGVGKRVEIKGKASELHAKFPGLCWIEEEGPGYVTYHSHQLPRDTFSRYAPVKMSVLMKRSIITRLKVLIESHSITITDPFTYQCLLAYQQLQPDVYGAPPGYYDDPVMSLAIASAALDSEGALAFTFGNVEEASRIMPKPEEVNIERMGSGPIVQFDVPAGSRRMVDILVPSVGQDVMADYQRLKELQGDDDIFRQLLGRG